MSLDDILGCNVIEWFVFHHVWSDLIINEFFPSFLPKSGDFLSEQLKTVEFDT